MVFVACLGCAAFAAADPIRVSGLVDGGGGELGTPWNAEDLQLFGNGFSIGSSLEDEVAFVQFSTVPTVAPGASVDFSGTLLVNDPIGAQLDDNRFALVTAPFTLSFHAAPARLSCTTTSSVTECTAAAPVTMTGDLTFTPLDGAPFMRHLVGRGTVQGTVFRTPSFEGGGVRYTFASTPEPATLSLFTLGAAMILRAARRRPRRQP